MPGARKLPPARSDADTAEMQAIVGAKQPFDALYRHWERHQWSPYQIDYSVDAATFARLDDSARAALHSIFAHFFAGEFNVARLLAPFLLAAPSYDVQLLLATQVADEHRHLQSILRVYADVFGVEGGIEAAQALSDANLDPVARQLFAALEAVVRALEADRDEDTFLRAIIGYHVLTEGSVARANQTLAASRFSLLGSFPGLAEAQRLAVRDEVRHVGIGISYARFRLARDGVHARALIEDLVGAFSTLGTNLVREAATNRSAGSPSIYDLDPASVWNEVRRQLDLRLRSIGLDPHPAVRA